MIAMAIVMDGDNCWPDLKTKGYIPGVIEAMAILDKGMASGRPSVAFRITLPDGEIVIAETSARLLSTGAKAINAKYPNLHEGD